MRKSWSKEPARGALLIIAAWLMLAAPALAQDETVRFFATVDRDRLEVGHTLTLTVTVSADSPELIRRLELPRPHGFEVVSTRQGTQTSFVFGGGGRAAERSTVHTLVLRATTSGVQSIPPASMEYRGRAYRTDAISVTVLPVGDTTRREERARDSSRGRGRPPSFFDDDFDPMDLFDQLQRQLEGDFFGAPPNMGGAPPPDVADEDVFARVGVDKTEVWLGEQLTADIVIYSRFDIGGFPTPPSMPQMEGFWQEDLERPTQIRPRTQNIRGSMYRTYMLRRLALFPTRAGEIVIDPVEVEVESAMGLFQGRRSTKRRSPSVPIKVRPLPVEGQPPGFSAGNVGDWHLRASLDRNSTTTGEPVTLILSVVGDGNVHSVEPPAPPEIDGLRFYEPTRTHETGKRAGRFGGTKTISWVIIPSRTGSFTIPKMDLHYFDPGAGRYRTSSAGPLTLAVTAGAPLLGFGSRSRTSGVNLLDAGGLRTIRYGITPSVVRPSAYRSPVFLGLLGISAAILIALVVVDSARRHLALVAEAGKGRRAPVIAKNRLKAARRRLRAGEGRQAVSACLGAMQDYLLASGDIRARGLPRDALRLALSDRRCPPDLAESLCVFIEKCESVRYSPLDPEEDEVASVIEEARGLLRKLCSVDLDEEGRG